jgi:hypothetical protein
VPTLKFDGKDCDSAISSELNIAGATVLEFLIGAEEALSDSPNNEFCIFIQPSNTQQEMSDKKAESLA